MTCNTAEHHDHTHQTPRSPVALGRRDRQDKTCPPATRIQASDPVFGRTNNPWDAARTSGARRRAATAAGLTSFDYGSRSAALPGSRLITAVCTATNRTFGARFLWSGHSSAPGNPGRWGKPTWLRGRAGARCPRHHPRTEATVGPMRRTPVCARSATSRRAQRLPGRGLGRGPALPN